jgi:hypothetical protein
MVYSYSFESAMSSVAGHGPSNQETNPQLFTSCKNFTNIYLQEASINEKVFETHIEHITLVKAALCVCPLEGDTFDRLYK